MKHGGGWRFRAVCALLLSLAAGSGWGSKERPFSPMYARNRLVAGYGPAGFADGNYLKATFHGPSGLALSPDGTLLYVADSGNHALRCVDLSRQNQVRTLWPRAPEGGPASDLKIPTDLLVSRDGQKLYLNDRGLGKILSMDLPLGRPTALFDAGPAGEGDFSCSGLVFSDDGSTLFFIDRAGGSLMAGDLRNLAPAVVMRDQVFREPLTRLVVSNGRFRVCAQNGRVFKLAVKGADVTPGSYKNLTQGAEVELVKIGFFGNAPNDDHDGAVAGLGNATPYEGIVCWNAKERCFNFFESMMQKLLVRDFAMVNRSTERDTPYLAGPLALAYDPDRHVIYAAEREMNRILAVNDDSRYNVTLRTRLMVGSDATAALFKKTDGQLQPEAAPKPVGVQRVLFLGGTAAYLSPGEDLDLFKALPSQFEFFLNFNSAFRGTGRQYEVVRRLETDDRMRNGAAYLLGHAGLLKEFQADSVLIPIDEYGLEWLANAWLEVPCDDDVPQSSWDPAWRSRPAGEKALRQGPASQAMAEACRKNPARCAGLARTDEAGRAWFSGECGTPLSLLEEPELGRSIRQMMVKTALKVVDLCRQTSTTPVFYVLPSVASTVREAPYSTCRAFGDDWCAALVGELRNAGVTVLDLQAPFSVLEPPAFPQWNPGDRHWLYRGQQTLAYVMAREFELQKAGQAGLEAQKPPAEEGHPVQRVEEKKPAVSHE